jgi:hypothetical protein
MTYHPTEKELARASADHAAADAKMLTSRVIVADWEYFALDMTDEDLVRDLHHTVVNVKTGEDKDINFSRHAYMLPTDILRLKDMGWPERNTTLGFPGGAWTSRDIELAWYRWRDAGRKQDDALSYGWIATFAIIALIVLAIFSYA